MHCTLYNFQNVHLSMFLQYSFEYMINIKCIISYSYIIKMVEVIYKFHSTSYILVQVIARHLDQSPHKILLTVSALPHTGISQIDISIQTISSTFNHTYYVFQFYFFSFHSENIILTVASFNQQLVSNLFSQLIYYKSFGGYRRI